MSKKNNNSLLILMRNMANSSNNSLANEQNSESEDVENSHTVLENKEVEKVSEVVDKQMELTNKLASNQEEILKELKNLKKDKQQKFGYKKIPQSKKNRNEVKKEKNVLLAGVLSGTIILLLSIIALFILRVSNPDLMSKIAQVTLNESVGTLFPIIVAVGSIILVNVSRRHVNKSKIIELRAAENVMLNAIIFNILGWSSSLLSLDQLKGGPGSFSYEVIFNLQAALGMTNLLLVIFLLFFYFKIKNIF